MKTDRERLEDIICERLQDDICIPHCNHGKCSSVKSFANYLISKGVTIPVRCGECKRCFEKRTKRNNQLMRFCMRMDGNEFQVNANNFCSYGERKDE